jgi:hypothetical protein
MAERTIHEFSAPSNTNVLTGPTTTVGDGNFELKPALINMVQANPFFGKPNEDANAHLQHFWRCVGLSLSVELQMMPSVFAYSRSHCSERRGNGFMQSEMS